MFAKSYWTTPFSTPHGWLFDFVLIFGKETSFLTFSNINNINIHRFSSLVCTISHVSEHNLDHCTIHHGIRDHPMGLGPQLWVPPRPRITTRKSDKSHPWCRTIRRNLLLSLMSILYLKTTLLICHARLLVVMLLELMVTILYDAWGDIEFDLSGSCYVALFLCQNVNAVRMEGMPFVSYTATYLLKITKIYLYQKCPRQSKFFWLFYFKQVVSIVYQVRPAWHSCQI